MSQPEALKDLLEAVAQGNLNPDAALEKLKYFAYEPVADFARIDHHRALQTGFPEVIWGPGKTPEQISQIIDRMRPSSPCVMATRITPEVFAQLYAQNPNLYVAGIHPSDAFASWSELEITVPQ